MDIIQRRIDNNFNLVYDLIHYISLQPFPSACTIKLSASQRIWIKTHLYYYIINVQPEPIFENFYCTSIKKIYYFIAVSFRYMLQSIVRWPKPFKNHCDTHTHTHKEYLSGNLLLYVLCAQNKHTHLSRQTFNSFGKKDIEFICIAY